jgi:replicative DNA helicase
MSAMQTIAPTLPHSAEAERLLLGAILSGHQDALIVVEWLRPEHFFLTAHSAIFQAVAALHSNGKPIDLLGVHEELGRTGKLEDAGGIAYVAKLGDGIPARLNLGTTGTLLREKAALREIAKRAEDICSRALAGGRSAARILDEGIEGLSGLALSAAEEGDDGVGYRDAAAGLLMEMDSPDGAKIFTDVEELDRLTGGFRPGELVVFTAETGVGKTLLAQQTRRRACGDGWRSLFCSAEMKATHLISRELATEAGVEHWKMRRRDKLEADDRDALTQAAARECSRCRILDGAIELSRIRRVARLMKRRDGLDLIVVDYDELVDAPGKDEFEQQKNLARGLKALAMELDCAAILISQLRKPLGGEDARRPTLQRLYGSGAKAKHASIVIYVDREFVRELKGDETQARIVVVKNRDGKVGAFDGRFNIKRLRFEGSAVGHTA